MKKEPKGLEKPRNLALTTIRMRLEGGDAPRMKRLGLWDPLVRSVQSSEEWTSVDPKEKKRILEVKSDR